MKISARNLWLAFLFLCALPLSILLSILYFFLKLTVRFEPLEKSAVPDNALLFFSHTHLYGVALNPFTKKNGPYPMYAFGYHGFLPYIWIVVDTLTGILFVLFDPRRRRSAQVIEFLTQFPERRYGIATDSGGPYGKVRSSLAKLSIVSDRPLVGIRVHFSKAISVFQHRIPLPGSRIKVSFLPTARPAELAALSEIEATARLQQTMDQMLR